MANADEEVGGGEGAEYFVRNLPFPLGEAYGLNEGGVGVTDVFGGGGKFFLLFVPATGQLVEVFGNLVEI